MPASASPPVVSLQPITAHTWRAAAELQVREDQQQYLTENVWSLAEAAYESDLEPFAIYAGDLMVGFLMIGLEPPEGRQWWLVRFMIASPYQRRGYGAASMRALLDMLCQRGLRSLKVGYHVDNKVAESLYLRQGFQPAGMAPWGEQTAIYSFGCSLEE